MMMLLAVLAAVVVLTPSEARACAAPACLAGQASPENGEAVPANAPAIVLVKDQNFFDPKDEPVGTLHSLHTSAALEVELTTEQHPTSESILLVTPKEGFEEGTDYVFRYTAFCRQSQIVEDGLPMEVHFRAAPAAPLPSTGGQLNADTRVEPEWRVWAHGTCVDTVKASVAHLEIIPSAELEPWLPLTRWHTAVDGEPWGTSTWGGLSSEGLRSVSGVFSRPPDRVHAHCLTPPPSIDPGVSRGTRVVTVTPEVAGIGLLPPLQTTIELSCEERPDAGTRDAGTDAGEAVAVLDDAGVAPPAQPPAEERDVDVGNGCGCTSSGTLVPFAAVLMLGLRRRRP